MAELAATTSSRPALGFASVVMRGSYQGRGAPPAAHGSGGETASYEPQEARGQQRLLGDLGRLHDVLVGELLQDREQAGVEEANLEEHQEWQRAVDLV